MNTLTQKLDLQKADKLYYSASKKPTIVDLDIYFFLTLEGQCAPEDPFFLESIEALYKVAYSIKFMMKEDDLDFVVPKLEGYWWVDQEIKSTTDFKAISRADWRWKIMIRMPDFVEAVNFSRAQYSAEQKNPEFGRIGDILFEKINMGRCAQILHVGSYEEEESSLDQLHQLVKSEGYQINGHHHEIYLSDPRRTAEHKLKTILRYGIA